MYAAASDFESRRIYHALVWSVPGDHELVRHPSSRQNRTRAPGHDAHYEADDGNRTRVFSLGKAIRCISRWFEKARSSNDATNQEVTSKSRDTPIHRY
jgi:hypothetical protein